MTTIPLAELAALGTSLCWSFSSIFFTLGTQRVGPMAVNRLRLVFAVLLVGAVHFFTYRTPFPSSAGSERYLWLTVSGVVGLVLGDSLLFYAYNTIGTRLGMLLHSLNPIFGTLFAWLLLGERLGVLELLAMVLALGGVAWVVMERTNGNGHDVAVSRKYALGIAAALGAGMCQALGLIAAKPALAGGFSALSALMIRMTAGMIVAWILAAVQGQARATVRALVADRQTPAVLFGGSFMGPFLGVWLSLVAVQSARIGIASTLMALSPIMLLPLVHWVFKERVSPRAAGGTMLAIAGIALMLLS